MHTIMVYLPKRMKASWTNCAARAESFETRGRKMGRNRLSQAKPSQAKLSHLCVCVCVHLGVL